MHRMGWTVTVSTVLVVFSRPVPSMFVEEPGIACPPEAIAEDEPCGFDTGGEDDFNAGCSMGGPGPPPDPLMPMACGETYCGEAYFDGMFRDTDWIEVLWEGDPGMVTIRAVAEFDLIIRKPFWAGPWNPCCEFFNTCTAIVPAGEVAVLRHRGTTTPGGAWYFLAPQFNDVFDCNDDAGFRWTATVSCEPLGPCSLDVDGEPGLSFGDVVTILSEWGDWGCNHLLDDVPSDLDGDRRVGFGDLLLVLTHWGPCEG